MKYTLKKYVRLFLNTLDSKYVVDVDNDRKNSKLFEEEGVKYRSRDIFKHFEDADEIKEVEETE